MTAEDFSEILGLLFTLYVVGFGAGLLHRTFIQIGDKL